VQGTNDQVGMRAPGSEQGRRGPVRLRRQIKCTQLQFWESARAASSAVVVPTPTDPMGFLKITRDFKARSAAKEYTNKVRSGGRDPGVRRPGAGLRQSPAHSKFSHAQCTFVCLFSPLVTIGGVRLHAGTSVRLHAGMSVRLHAGSMPRGERMWATST